MKESNIAFPIDVLKVTKNTMLKRIIQEFARQMEAESTELENKLPQSLHFADLERQLTAMTNQFVASVLQLN